MTKLVGVAGLAAVQTAKNMGAIVRAVSPEPMRGLDMIFLRFIG